jgi:hypothetical protein
VPLSDEHQDVLCPIALQMLLLLPIDLRRIVSVIVLALVMVESRRKGPLGFTTSHRARIHYGITNAIDIRLYYQNTATGSNSERPLSM